MIISFNSSTKKPTKVLVFLCLKSKPLDPYLLEINRNNRNYIDKAIKIGKLEYTSNSCLDLILPNGTEAERILLIGVNEKI